MTPARLFLLACLLAAAAAGVWWLSRADPPAPPAAAGPTSQEPFLRGEAGAVTRLTIHHPQIKLMVRLERETPDRWRLTEPILDRAEPAALRNALQVLFGGDWAETPAEWQSRSDADLGLDPPRLAVEIELEGGVREVLLLGAAGLRGDTVAAAANGRRLRLPVVAYSILSRPALDWRDHGVWWNPQAVHLLEWRPRQGGGMVLQRVDGRWRLREPLQAPLGAGAQDAVARLLGARCPSLPEEILTEASRRQLETGDVLVAHGPGGTQTLRLLDGLAACDQRPYALPIYAEDFQVLRQDPASLRSRRLLDLDEAQIVSLRLRRGATEAVFRRRASGWARGGADTQPEVDAAVSELVRRLCAFEPGATRELPVGEAAGEILLSRSLQPVERGGALLRWWQVAGQSWIAGGDSRQAAAADFNLDLGVQALLGE